MSYSLTLEIPDTVYAPLVKAAAQSGQTPEEWVVGLLRTATEPVVDDPIEPFIGALSSQVSDWLDGHDTYLGEVLLDTHESDGA